MLRPVRTVAPAEPVVGFTELARWCRAEDVAEEADFFEVLGQAAVDRLDGWSGLLGRCIVNQTWRLDLGGWPAGGCIRLPFPDVSAVSVAYSDEVDSEQTVSSSLYELLEDGHGALLRFREAFTAPSLYDDRSDPVRVTLTAGYGAASAVPETLKMAIRQLVAHWYDNREAAGRAMSEIPEGVRALIEPYKRRRL